MNRAGALELVMPVVQPAELWQESGRWSEYGPELLRIKDRHERDFVAGPTHEEVITDIARRELQELPPAAGELLPDPDEVPRRDPAALRRDARARVHHEGRLLLPRRRGLAAGRLSRDVRRLHAHLHAHWASTFRAVRADSGAIGGDVSQEFHVLADSGEDAIVFSDGDDYAANLEAAAALPPDGAAPRARASR